MEYDVIVIGGGLAGLAAATLLPRERPDFRVLVIEKSTHFTRRVGEATVEISGFFLGRVLGLTSHLNESHLVKQGMRFWFANDEADSLGSASEIGGKFQVRLPAYQVDRSVLDEEVLARAVALGAELRRPASVEHVALAPGGSQTVTVRENGTTTTLSARWVIDASGVAALLARQEGWWRPNTAHPTTACWARWRGVKDWDGLELAKKFPEWAAACYAVRGTATNHITGDGWWSWWIPLKGGDMSVGVVFDQRLVEWPAGSGNNGDKLKAFLSQHPVARELLVDAEPIAGDVHWRKNLPYSTTTYAGDGFALVGDASAFLDPFYSPGMDWISFTTYSAVQLVLAQQAGEPMADRVAQHNRTFLRSYERWFEAIYRDKYEYFGDYELMSVAFPLDLGLYYMGIASQPFKRGADALLDPPFNSPASVPFFHFMRGYNRLLARIARSRRARGTLGRHNAGRRLMLKGFTFGASSVPALLRASRKLLVLAVTEGLFPTRRKPSPRPLDSSVRVNPA